MPSCSHGNHPGSIYRSPALCICLKKKKEVISSWDAELDRPQTTSRDSVGSELAQYKTFPKAHRNLPHLGWIHCRPYQHTTTACSVLDAAVGLEGSGRLGGQAHPGGIVHFWTECMLNTHQRVGLCALSSDGCHRVLLLEELGRAGGIRLIIKQC